MKQFIINHVNELTQLSQRLSFNTDYYCDSSQNCGRTDCDYCYSLAKAVCDLRLPTFIMVKGDRGYNLITLQVALDRSTDTAHQLIHDHLEALKCILEVCEHVVYIPTLREDQLWFAERIEKTPSVLEAALLGEGVYEVPIFIKTKAGYYSMFSEKQLHALFASLVSSWRIAVDKSLGVLLNHQVGSRIDECENEMFGSIVDILEDYGV